MMDQRWCTRAAMEVIELEIGVACLTVLDIAVAPWRYVKEVNHGSQLLLGCTVVGTNHA